MLAQWLRLVCQRRNPVIAIRIMWFYAKSSSVTVDAGFGFDSYLWSAGEVTNYNYSNCRSVFRYCITQGHGSCLSLKFQLFASNVPNSKSWFNWTDADNSGFGRRLRYWRL
jgi:hypothetical protein